MIELKNNKIFLKINELGAELTSLSFLNKEILWQKNEKWQSQSPILFPIVGKLKNDFYIYENIKYDMPRHGFARKSIFSIKKQKSNLVNFSLKNFNINKNSYPFNFSFNVIYKIKNSSLKVVFKVKNIDKKTLFCNFGFHPGFNLTNINCLLGKDLFINFKPKKLMQFEFDPIYVKKKKLVQLKRIKLEEIIKSLVETDTLCYSKLRKIEISNDKNSLTFKTNMKNMALWGSKVSPELFCVEGWEGLPDFKEFNNLINNKPQIIALKPNRIITKKFKISLKEVLK